MTRVGSPGHRIPHVRASALLISLVLVAAPPTAAMASHGSHAKTPVLPNCARFSLVKLAQAIKVSSLTLEGTSPLSDTCLYKTPRIPEHYAQLLTISLQATSRAVFDRAKLGAKQEVTNAGGTFHSFGPTTFGVSVVHESSALKPCLPGHTVPEFGPPYCKGDPAWATGTVYSYASLKPKGPKVFLSVGLGREYGSFGAQLLSLSKKILSGRIS